MFLGEEQLSKISYGKISINKNENGYSFSRFTEKQKDVWAIDNPYFDGIVTSGYFLRNCYTYANICLDFFTNSRKISLSVSKVKPVNGHGNNITEIFVNGKKVLEFDKIGTYSVELKRKSRVQVFFPYFGDVCLQGVEVDDGCLIEPVKKNIRWLCIGDSITHGCHATCPSKTYVSRIANKYNIDVINQGNSGYVNDERVIDKIPSWKPDIVTSAYGRNDFDRKTREQFKDELFAHCKKLKETFKDSKVYIIAPIWAVQLYEDEKVFERRDEMYKVFDEIGKKLDLPIIDGRRLVPNDKKYLQKDGTHPNDAGFMYYASRLGKILFE